MDQVKAMSDSELLVGAQVLRAREKEALYALLIHLGEIDQRKLYLEQGYSSLFSYLEVGLGYSKGGLHTEGLRGLGF